MLGMEGQGVEPNSEGGEGLTCPDPTITRFYHFHVRKHQVPKGSQGGVSTPKCSKYQSQRPSWELQDIIPS